MCVCVCVSADVFVCLCVVVIKTHEWKGGMRFEAMCKRIHGNEWI